MTVDNMTLDEINHSFLAEAQIDYIGLWEIVWCCSDSDSEIIYTNANPFDVVRFILSHGLVAGNFSATWDFAPWPDQHPDSVIDRIRREWAALGRPPTMYELAWFDLPSRHAPIGPEPRADHLPTFSVDTKPRRELFGTESEAGWLVRGLASLRTFK